jgi:hypothetical protein
MEKKAYASPELKVHGTVEELTLRGAPVCPPPGSSKLVSGPDTCNLMSPPDGTIS